MYKLIKELHTAFDHINNTKYEGKLIAPVIMVQKNENKKKTILGWCSCLPRWIRKINGKENELYEITITTDSLNRPYEDTIGTLIHEMVHLYHGQNGIVDCNPRSQKHNELFKEEAERLGMIVEQGKRTGWSQTKVGENLLNEIHRMNLDVTAFDLHTITVDKAPKEPKPKKPVYKYVCPHCGTELKTNEEQLAVTCVDCECEYIKVLK